MSARHHDDPTPADGALVVTARTVCEREVGRADIALVAVCCTACFRSIPPDDAVRTRRHDWRCRDRHDCREAQARHDAEAARRAAMMDEEGR